MSPEPPSKLHKFKTFNVNTLKMLHQGTAYYADPKTFNDPLDCNPEIDADISLEMIEEIIRVIWPNHTLPYAFGKTAEQVISETKHHIFNQNGDDFISVDDSTQRYRRQLSSYILDSIKNEIGVSGVFSLSEEWKNVLMWSHYAEDHKGICIEFDTYWRNYYEIIKINYHGSRVMKLSDIYKWKVHKDSDAERTLYDQYYSNKSSDWKYEKEWRVLSKHIKEEPAPFYIGAIYFGLRSDIAVKSAIYNLFSPTQSITFYQMFTLPNGFGLQRRELDCEDKNYLANTALSTQDTARAFGWYNSYYSKA